jgi:hypothetical protein
LPLNHDFQSDSIAEFLRNLPTEGDLDILKRWTVALVTPAGDRKRISLAALPGLDITATIRRVAEKKATGSLLISGKSSRVGSPRDVRHGLSSVEVQRVREENGADASSDTFRLALPAPLLVIYLIQGIVREDPKDRSKDRPYRDGLILPALAAHFPGVSDPDAPRRLVRYRLNRIAQDVLLGVDRDDEDDADDDPDD